MNTRLRCPCRCSPVRTSVICLRCWNDRFLTSAATGVEHPLVSFASPPPPPYGEAAGGAGGGEPQSWGGPISDLKLSRIDCVAFPLRPLREHPRMTREV